MKPYTGTQQKKLAMVTGFNNANNVIAMDSVMPKRCKGTYKINLSV